MHELIEGYNNLQTSPDKEICENLAKIICENLAKSENKIWHGHPVWFINGNPIVGYSKLKNNVRLLFWSGQSFDEEILQNTGNFKAAQIDYAHPEQINTDDLVRLLSKSEQIQWDYKNIVKRKGELVKLTKF